MADRAVRDALARAPDGVGPTAEEVDGSAWRAWGRLDRVEHAAEVREALAEVIAPCARALLAGTAPRGEALSARAGARSGD